MSATPRGALGRQVLLVAGLVLIAFNLRPTLAAIAPVLNAIRADHGMDATAAGVLTMLPVACLGIFGALAARLARRIGTEPTVAAALALVAAGSLLRGAGPVAALYAGSTLVGAGVGVLGVLLPGIVKRDFPARAGLMTGVFTTMLVGGGAAGAGATIPLAEALGGWRPALMAWAAPALLAMLVWLPQLVLHRHRPRDVTPPARLWRDRLAWQVTLFMGLQSALAHTTMGWMPVVLEEKGLSAAHAGFVAAVSIAVQMITAMLVPPFAARRRAQRAVAVTVIAGCGAGMGAIFLGGPALFWPGAVLAGLALGGSMGVAMTIIVLRAPDGRTAAELSAMAQSVGYLIAATGPFMVGLLRDASGGWTVPGLFFLVTAGVAMAVGAGAGRDSQVGTKARAATPA